MTKTLSDLPSDYWKHEAACRNFAELFSRYMVSLLIVYEHEGSTQHVLYSGFLYRHQETSFWMTAGHVVHKLIRIRESGVEIVKAEWLDLAKDGSGHGIPVDLQRLELVPCEKEGLDFGFVPIESYYERLLNAVDENDFLDEHAYFNRENAAPEGFYLLGFPSELQDVTEKVRGKSVNYSLRASMCCLPLEKIADRSDKEPPGYWGCEGSLYFRIQPFDGHTVPALDDIKGMSGGPIMSIERTPEDQMRYYLFGVQGSWVPGQRIIRVTDCEAIGAIMDALFKLAREAQSLHS